MKILLDECLPKKLRVYLADHSVVTATEAGWSAYENGELANQASGHYDVILTADKRFAESAGSLQGRIAVIVLRAESNRIESLEPLIPLLLDALRKIRCGETIILAKAELHD